MRQLAILLLSFSLAAFAQNADQSSKSAKSKAAKSGVSSDTQFVTKAAQGNLAEVALGQLATQKAQSDDVKKFGQRMVDDHQKAEQDLEGVASKNSWSVPKEPSAEQKAEQQRLEKLSGAAFDRAYMQMMVKDHTKDIAEFKKESHSTTANADLRDFANRTYPTLDDHLTNAKAVNDALSKSSKSGAASSTGKSSGKKSKPSPSGAAGLLII